MMRFRCSSDPLATRTTAQYPQHACRRPGIGHTLGEWCARLPQHFHVNAPVPKYLKTVYDFKTRYAEVSLQLKGFTKAGANEAAVHAFRVARDSHGDVGLWWAPYASLSPGVWRGLKGEQGDVFGLSKLRRLPLGPLVPMRTNFDTIPKKKAAHVTSKSLHENDEHAWCI